MEYRKLISFGKSSHVVSIPKEWMTKNSLKKGDVVSLDFKDDNLILRPKEAKNDVEHESKIVISTEGKSLRHIETEIVSAYINNYGTIVIEGYEVKNNTKGIQEAIHDLIALEVMEQNAERIVAKDFLNMKDINIKNLIQKMDIVARAMISDAKKTFDEDNCDNIKQRDKDLNRLFFLACRAIKYGLRNPLIVNQLFNIESPEELMNYRLASTYLEKISDTAKRLSRYMHQAKFSEKQKNDFIKLYDQIEHQYLEMMTAYYSQDKDKALRLCDKKEALMKLCDDLYFKNKSNTNVTFLITELKHMLIRVYSIGRVVYQ